MLWRSVSILLMLLGLLGCEDFGRKEGHSSEPRLVDSLKVKFPGRRFESVQMYKMGVWLNGDYLTSDSLWNAEGELDNGFLKPPQELIPAHIADLNVSLWHQKPTDLPSTKPCNFREPLAVIYRDISENPIAGFIFDINCRQLRTWPVSTLTLNERGWKRLEMLTKETLQ